MGGIGLGAGDQGQGEDVGKDGPVGGANIDDGLGGVRVDEDAFGVVDDFGSDLLLGQGVKDLELAAFVDRGEGKLVGLDEGDVDKVGEAFIFPRSLGGDVILGCLDMRYITLKKEFSNQSQNQIQRGLFSH